LLERIFAGLQGKDWPGWTRRSDWAAIGAGGSRSWWPRRRWAKGYRILERRCRTPYGEIDLIAVRGRRLAFVEVKRRRTRLEAEAALTQYQARRIVRAADFWVARNARYRDHDRGLDAILVVPRRLPAHLPDALQVEFKS
jgi:putative endonuclease